LAEPDVYRSGVFFRRQPKKRLERVEELLTEQLPIGEVDQRIEVGHTLLGEDVRFLGERRLRRFRRDGDGGAGIRSLEVRERRVQLVDHREEDEVELLLRVLREQQVVDVRDADLRREAWIDRAASRSFAIELAAREVGVDEVAARHTKRLEIAAEEGR